MSQSTMITMQSSSRSVASFLPRVCQENYLSTLPNYPHEISLYIRKLTAGPGVPFLTRVVSWVHVEYNDNNAVEFKRDLPASGKSRSILVNSDPNTFNSAPKWNLDRPERSLSNFCLISTSRVQRQQCGWVQVGNSDFIDSAWVFTMWQSTGHLENGGCR